jgi:hypothetical protein
VSVRRIEALDGVIEKFVKAVDSVSTAVESSWDSEVRISFGEINLRYSGC